MAASSSAIAQNGMSLPSDITRVIGIPPPPIVREKHDASPVRIITGPVEIKSCNYIELRTSQDDEAQIAKVHFAMGLQRLNANDPRCAIPLFDMVLAKFPFFTPALADRALAKAQLGDWDGAEVDADRAISLDGTTSVAFNVRGIVAARRGDHQQAIAAFSRAIELVPKDIYAHLQRVRSYIATGQVDAARSDADWLMTRAATPHNVDVAAGIMADIGFTESALARVDTAIRTMKGARRAELLRTKAHLLVRMHRSIEAIDALDKAIKAGPTAAFYLDRAETGASIDRAQALKDVEAARRLDPQSSDVVRIHAWLLTEGGEGAAAIALVDQALATKPGDAMLLGARAYAHQKLGQRDAMLDDLDAARLANPADMLTAEATCLVKAQNALRLDSARSDCDAAVAADPYRKQALLARGLLFLQTGHAGEAMRDYELASRIDTTDADARVGHGIALLRSGDVAAGNAEIVASKTLDAEAAKRFAGYGVAP